jgi:hypothetical protein
MRNTFLVCYDIRDDKRLRHVYKAMRDFGDHLQYSIFECQFTPIDLAKCRHVLGDIIKHNGADRGAGRAGDHGAGTALFADLGALHRRVKQNLYHREHGGHGGGYRAEKKNS